LHRDLRELLQLYRELEEEQELLLSNLDLNWQRIRTSRLQADRRIREAEQRFKRVSFIDFAPLLESYRSAEAERQVSIESLENIEKLLAGILEKQWAAYRFYVDRLVLAGGPDLRDPAGAGRHSSPPAEQTVPELREPLSGQRPDLRKTPERYQPGSTQRQYQRILRERQQLRKPDTSSERYDDLKEKARDQSRRLQDQIRGQGY